MTSRAVRLGIGVALAAALLVLFARGIDPAALAHAVAGADPMLVLAVLVLTVLAYAARSWRWGELMSPLARLGQADLFSATVIGFAASLVVPRSGELLRPWLISRRGKVPASSAFATIVVERLVDLASVLAMLALYLFVLPRPAAERPSRWIGLLEAGAAATTAVLLVAAAVLWVMHARGESGARLTATLLRHAPAWLQQRATSWARGFAAGLVVLRAPASHWWRVVWQSIVVWALTGLSLVAANLAFGIELPVHSALLLLAFVAIGEAIPTPGLVGGFHALYLLALTEVYGVDRTTAAAATIVAHVLVNLPPLLLGAWLAPRQGLSWRGAVSGAGAS